MSMTRPPSMFARMRSLFRGIFRRWVKEKELEHPEAVYEQAISERVRQYRELKDAVAGILFLRNKLEGEVTERRAEIARLHDDARRAVRRGHDDASLQLIARKQALFEDLERAEKELEGVRIQGAEAKSNLIEFREEIRGLVREKSRMLATLANAQARRRLQAAIEGLSVDAELDALAGVREQVSRLSLENSLDHEIGDADLRSRLRAFRDEARVESARSELEELKRELGGRQLPSSSSDREREETSERQPQRQPAAVTVTPQTLASAEGA